MNKSRFVTLDDHINVNLTDHLLNYVVGAAIWPKDGQLVILIVILTSLESIQILVFFFLADVIPFAENYQVCLTIFHGCIIRNFLHACKFCI